MEVQMPKHNSFLLNIHATLEAIPKLLMPFVLVQEHGHAYTAQTVISNFALSLYCIFVYNFNNTVQLSVL